MLFLILNALVVVGLVAATTRLGPTERFALPRFALLALLVWADTCVVLWWHCEVSSVAYLALLVIAISPVVPDPQFSPLTKRLCGGQFAIYMLSVVMVSLLAHIHLPVGTFLTSPGEIRLHVDYLLTNNAVQAMVFVFLAAALYAFALSPRMRTALCLLATTTALVTVVFSYVLPFGYPMMSGLSFEQIPIPNSELMTRAAIDAGAVVLCALAVVLAVYKLRRATLVGILAATNVAFLITTLLTISRADDSGIGAAGGGTSMEQPLALSKTEPNVMIIMLDRFMGGFVEGILQHDKDLSTRLAGFTWYPRTIAAGENSIAGVHPIFGGYDYTPKEMNAREGVLRDLSVEAYRILPHNFSGHGYVSNIVNPRGLGFTMAGDCSYIEDIKGVNCSHVSPDVATKMAEVYNLDIPLEELSRSNYAELLVLLGSMRGAPYSLKHVLNEKGPWKPFMDHSAGTTLRQWAELKALPLLTATDSSKPNLNIFWNILPHEPYFMGPDCLPMPQRFELSEAELKSRGATSLFEVQHAIAARCSLLLVADYIDWMKAKGVYNNTKIVIVSDHGIVGPVRDRSSLARRGGTTSRDFVNSRSVLMVKDRSAQGPLQISERFLPNAEVPNLVCQEIGGCVNPFLDNRAIESAGRDDPFFVDLVPWQFSAQELGGFVIKTRLKLEGKDPYRRESWSAKQGGTAE